LGGEMGINFRVIDFKKKVIRGGNENEFYGK